MTKELSINDINHHNHSFGNRMNGFRTILNGCLPGWEKTNSRASGECSYADDHQRKGGSLLCIVGIRFERDSPV